MRIKKLKIITVLLFFSQIIIANKKEEVLVAINNNDLETVQSIIKSKTQANWKIHELPLLYYAAYGGHDMIADYLVEKDADILWDNGSDNSVLHAACRGCIDWLVQLILAKSTRQVNMPINMDFPTPIEIASSVGCEASVKRLLQTGKILNKEGAIKSALLNKNYNVAQLIIDSINIDTLQIDGQHPFFFVYRNAEPEAIELLTKNGLDIDAILDPNDPDNETLFYTSLKARKPDFVKVCLRNGASFNRKVKYKNYGEPVTELPVLDLLFKSRYLGDYNSEKWTEIANLLINKAGTANDMSLITSDFKNVLDLSISRKYTPLFLNLVYQGEKCGIKIMQDDSSEISPDKYLSELIKKDVTPEMLKIENEAQKIFDAIDANDIKKLRKLINADNYYAYSQCKRTIVNGEKEQEVHIFDYAIHSGNIKIVQYLFSNGLTNPINANHYYIAANNHNTEIFKYLVKVDKDFDQDGKWILYQIHDPVFVEILLKNGVNADEYIFNGQSFLFYEFRRGNLETINLFLKYSNVISDDYKRLFFAIEQNDIKTIKNIISKGIDINQLTSGGLTPLCWAAYLGQYDVAKLLIDNNAEVSVSWKQNEGNDPYPVFGSAPLRWAIENEHSNIVKLLIEHKASPIIFVFLQEGLNVFHLAAIKGNVEIMKMLIEAYGNGNNNDGYEENAGTLSDLYNVFYNMNEVSVFNNKVATPFDIASYYGHIDLCQLFLDNGFGVENPGKKEYKYYTPLYFAVAGRQFETAKFLIEKGANVNLDGRNTIIKECAWNGTSDILKLLIDNGAPVNIEVLIDASKHRGYEGVKAVVSAIGNKTDVKENSFSIFYNIINNEHIADKTGIINYLIDNGININSHDDDGTTLLHLATEKNDEQLVRFLLDKEIRINPVTTKTKRYSKSTSRTALDLATYYPVYKILKDHGAKTACEIL